MRIAVVSAKGQLGAAVVQAAGEQHEVVTFERRTLDVTDAAAVEHDVGGDASAGGVTVALREREVGDRRGGVAGVDLEAGAVLRVDHRLDRDGAVTGVAHDVPRELGGDERELLGGDARVALAEGEAFGGLPGGVHVGIDADAETLLRHSSWITRRAGAAAVS